MTGVGFIVVLLAIGLFVLAFNDRLPEIDFGGLRGSLAWAAGDGTALLWFAAATLLVMLLFFLAVAIIRFALRPIPAAPSPPAGTDATGQVVVRDRIAPIILGIGSVAILAITIAILVAFTYLATRGPNGNQDLLDKIDTIYMGLFTAVLPVFATWVGTVIAFYYTNDAFRQAAASTRETLSGTKTTGPGVMSIMIPYDKIVGMKPPTREAANAIKLADIKAGFNTSTTRMIVFEAETKNPIYIIRSSLIDEPLAANANATIADYRKLGNRGSDSVGFGFVPEAASVEDARQIMRTMNYKDIFVSALGQKTEAILGWVTDDVLLKGGPN
jgi:hypothetical protein